ncbi:hypothetical protein L6258_00200 [Candidatus Parcubacteria bacterium]|nr:hypothetical protein [Candidatus Parcubacteria bacterium]
MLEKRDLNQIRDILQNELKPVKKDISELKSDVHELKADVSELKSDVSVLKQDMTSVKSDTTKIRRDVSAIITFFDHEYLTLRRRIERIEEVLSLPPLTEVST